MSKPQLYMPAEWQPQAATWLSWPHNVETWPENLAAVQAEFIALVHAIAGVQPVKVLAAGPAYQQAAQSLGQTNNVELINIPTNDAWARDYAPTFVKDQTNGELAAINWYYNAWGGKYPPFDEDQQVAPRIGNHLGLQVFSPDLCFEGGAIEVNDSRVMLCTLSCALDPQRNPGKSLGEIESIFRQFLGVEKIVWLSGDAIAGDDTDGHIDQLARFTDDHTIVYSWCDREGDPQSAGLAKNLQDLKSGLADIGCADYRLFPLPIPPEIVLHDRRVPASYCNFLICNGLVIVPQFGCPAHDRIALDTLTDLFPHYQLIALDSVNLSVGLGSFHCLTQQQPAANK